MASLNETARAIVAPGKGILAADESSGTIKKRFDSIGCESTEDRRRAYRELLFTSSGAADHISGVILFDETIRQQSSDGRPLVRVLEEAGIIPGIKVDKGTTPLAKSPSELVTDGLDGLRGAARRVPGARCAVREVARGDRHRPRHPLAVLHRRERARARALRRAVPGRRHRSDRRARSVDGRRPLDRALLDGHDRNAAHRLRHADRAARGARRHVAEAQHGDSREEALGRARRRREEVARRRSRASGRSCPRRCPASCSCRAARTTKRPPPTSTPSTGSVRSRGSCRTRTDGRCSTPRCTAWKGDDANAGGAQSAFLHRAKMNGLARDARWTPEAEKGCVVGPISRL